jgi:hypothetical protein
MDEARHRLNALLLRNGMSYLGVGSVRTDTTKI